MHLKFARGSLNAIVAALLFVGMGIILNLFDAGFPFESIHFFRAFVAALFLFPFVVFVEPENLKPSKKDLKGYALIGLILAISFVTWNTAMVTAPIGTMVVLSNSAMFFVILLSFLLLGEKITKREAIACLVGIVGILILNPLEPVRSFATGLILISAFTYAFAVLLIRKEEHDHSPGIAFWYLLFAAVFLSPLLFIGGFSGMEKSLWLIVPLGLFNALAYLTKTWALKYETADLVQIIALIVSPIAAILAGMLFLNQMIELNVIVGAAVMIIAGLIVGKELFIKS